MNEDERVSLESLLPYVKQEDLDMLTDHFVPGGGGIFEDAEELRVAIKEEQDKRDGVVQEVLEHMDRAFDGSLS